MSLSVEFIDSGRLPVCAPDPVYPDGCDVDASAGATKTCTAVLYYPAPRCGVYIVSCSTCGLKTGLTVAGRPDDVRTVKLACFSQVMNPNPPGVMQVRLGGSQGAKMTPHQEVPQK